MYTKVGYGDIMKYLIIKDRKYELLKNYKDAFSIEAITEKLTEYFYMYDYIVGDFSYGKLRLKGFCKKENQNFRASNDYDTLNSYIKNYCAYDCKYFVLENLEITESMNMDEI